MALRHQPVPVSDDTGKEQGNKAIKSKAKEKAEPKQKPIRAH
jgi:hypothetical protein